MAIARIADGDRRVWKSTVVFRAEAVVVSLMSVGAAILCATSPTVTGGVSAGVWVYAFIVVAWMLWWGFWPQVELGDMSMTVRNPIFQHVIAYRDIVALRPGYWGLNIDTVDRRHIAAFAVQQANAVTWLKMHGRSHDVINNINARRNAEGLPSLGG